MKTEIVYEDECVIVCYKPAGIATQTAKVGQQDVVSELKNYFAGKNSLVQGKSRESYLGIVHRLDQPVEGLLVFAKDARSAAFLSKQLKEGILNKDYMAVVCGKAAVREGTLVDDLAKAPDGRAVIRTYAGDAKAGEQKYDFKKAVLHYEIESELELAPEKAGMRDATDVSYCISLAKIHIETGRFHQIRAQLSHAGLPILGDRKYGNDESVILSETLDVRSVALCAYRLEFLHPKDKKKNAMHFEIKPRGEVFGRYLQE